MENMNLLLHDYFHKFIYLEYIYVAFTLSFYHECMEVEWPSSIWNGDMWRTTDNKCMKLLLKKYKNLMENSCFVNWTPHQAFIL
jgi:hypothetical protein